MAATDRSRSEAAKQRRQDQLQRWLGSETDTGAREEPEEENTGGPGGPGGPGPGGGGGGLQKNRVRFAQGAVFMAACSAGDLDEVSALLRQGADINHSNVDGLTALHQACIDENSDMVQFLVDHGSDVNHGDNEGWTPLHAAASCAFIQIAKYLIEHGAHVGAVNSEGELPLDVATDDAMSRLLKAEIKKQGIDVDQARKEEERVMLEDAKAVLAGSGTLRPHPNTKATALHVAAAKGYIEVMKVLLQSGIIDVDSTDSDLWTPLHAAAHWGQEEVCTLLSEHMCDMTALNNVGQTPLDVADENLVDKLEELQKKQNALRSEREKLAPVIDTSPPISMAPLRTRRTSISRMSSREKICLHERDKHPPPPALHSTPTEEDEEEGGHGQSQTAPPQAKASSSSSSEEESESESDAESEKAKNREIINNLNNKRNNTSTSLLSTSMATSTAGNTGKKEPAKPSAAEAPGSWRTSLRKAGSSVTLGSAGVPEPGQDPSRPADPMGLGLGMTRSASSPRLSSEAADTKEPRLARVPPTRVGRLFSIPDSSSSSTAADSATNSWLSRSSSYTRRSLHSSQSGSDLSGSASSNAFLPRSSSYGRRLDDPGISSASSGLNRLNNLVSQRLTQEAPEKKEQPSITSITTSSTSGTTTTTTSTTSSGSSVTSSTAGDTETKQRRKSYLTPVRDEEAEAQRKARSRHARQSRRSTQGVTLTDLQEAEKSMKTTENKENKEKLENKGKVQKQEEEEREQDKDKDNKKKAEEGEVSWRSRIASLQKSDLLGLTQPAGTPRTQASDKKDGVVVGTGESETERWARESRERRRARARRRGQRTGESDDNEPSGEDDVSGSTTDTQQSERPLTSRSDPAGGSAGKDYKKLFEDLSRENNQLHVQLQDTQRTISQTRVELEKAAQRQERFSDCSALLELEKKERRVLERRVAELEEELKVLGDLRADNQRLKDENGALIRVISKLSK